MVKLVVVKRVILANEIQSRKSHHRGSSDDSFVHRGTRAAERALSQKLFQLLTDAQEPSLLHSCRGIGAYRDVLLHSYHLKGKYYPIQRK